MKISGFVLWIHVMALIVINFVLAWCIILYVDAVHNEHSDSSHFQLITVKPEADIFKERAVILSCV
jgi:hypothetical protein